MEKEERPKRKRREKAKPLEVELDVSGGYSRGNMSMSSLENGKEAHLVVLGNFKQKEDVEIPTQLPD